MQLKKLREVAEATSPKPELYHNPLNPFPESDRAFFMTFNPTQVLILIKLIQDQNEAIDEAARLLSDADNLTPIDRQNAVREWLASFGSEGE